MRLNPVCESCGASWTPHTPECASYGLRPPAERHKTLGHKVVETYDDEPTNPEINLREQGAVDQQAQKRAREYAELANRLAHRAAHWVVAR